MAGAFQTSRDIFGSPIWKNVVDFRLFFLIYGNAVFSEEGVRLAEDLTLNRGEWCRSTRKIQEDLEYIENRQVKRYSTSVINRCIKRLEGLQMVCTRTHQLGTVFTVVNYQQYQGLQNYKKHGLGTELGTLGEHSGNNNNKENKDNKRTTCPKQVYDEQSIPYRTANYLYSNILKHKPDLKKPNLQIWANDMRKLIELDKRDPKKVGEVIEWATQDSFWQTNILSASKLRDKWDSITARMKSAGGYKGGNKNVIHFQEVQVDEKEREHLANMARKQAERNGIQNAVNE